MKQINFNDYAIKLSRGSHYSPESGMCVMECVAYIAGEAHTDVPECADHNLGHLAIMLNDSARDEQRQRLLPLVLRLAGSKTEDFMLAHKRAKQAMAAREALNNACAARRKWGHPDMADTAWDAALEKLDSLLPPLDLSGLAPEKAEVVETKLRELEEVTK